MVASIKPRKAKKYCIGAAVIYLGYNIASNILVTIVLCEIGRGGISTNGLSDCLIDCIAIILAGIMLQRGLNNLVATKPINTQNNKISSLNQYENLTKLKELLDSGAITQEEFDEKKKELLNM